MRFPLCLLSWLYAKRSIKDHMRAVSILAASLLLSASAAVASDFPVNESLIPSCARAHPSRDPNYNYTVFFDEGSLLLSTRARQVLSEIAERWKRYGGFFIEASGYTDAPEARHYTPSLALKRVNTIRKFLVTHGIETDRIITRSFGAREQLVPSEGSEPQNRRVAILPFFRGSKDEDLNRLREQDRLDCKMWVKDHCLFSSPDEHASVAACNEALDMATGR